LKVQAGTDDKKQEKTELEEQGKDNKNPSPEYHPDPFIFHTSLIIEETGDFSKKKRPCSSG
jgi:hypothetical protein